jgi:glucose/arabinose dehydrogenase
MMGIYLNAPGRDLVAVLIAAGAQRLSGPPSSLAAVPAGAVLVAATRSGAGFPVALVVADGNDYAAATTTDRPVTWLLMDAAAAEPFAGRSLR